MSTKNAIIVAVDGSDASRVGVRAVSSWLDNNIYASPGALQVAQEHAETLQREQQATLQRFMRGLARRYPDIALELQVSRGRPADALARAAEPARLLVVGSHGRGGFIAAVLGSASRELLQKSPCPLMAVRPEL